MISHVTFSLLHRKLEVAAASFLRSSKSKWHKRQLKAGEGLPEQRSEMEDGVLLGKEKAVGAVKAGAFQAKLYGLSQVFVAKNPQYELITTEQNVFEYPSMGKDCADTFVDLLICLIEYQHGFHVKQKKGRF